MRDFIDKIKTLELNYNNDGSFHNSLPKEVYVVYNDEDWSIDVALNYSNFSADITYKEDVIILTDKESDELYDYFKESLDKEIEVIKDCYYAQRYEY